MRLGALRDGKRRDRLGADASRRAFRRGGELLSAAIAPVAPEPESCSIVAPLLEPGEVASEEHAANNAATRAF
jgi:hypothetical protein